MGAQLRLLDSTYPGGLQQYYQRALRLVKESSDSVNPYADYHVNVPSGVKIHFNQNNFEQVEHYEKLGMK